MPQVELLTVKDTFWLGRNGATMLILIPDFSIPPGWEQHGWSQRQEPVVVLKPNGQQIEATAQINMTHLNIPDPSVSIDKRWRLTVWLTDRTKEEIPLGSKILVPPQIRDAIIPPNTV
jgi:hypothetical protein